MSGSFWYVVFMGRIYPLWDSAILFTVYTPPVKDFVNVKMSFTERVQICIVSIILHEHVTQCIIYHLVSSVKGRGNYLICKKKRGLSGRCCQKRIGRGGIGPYPDAPLEGTGISCGNISQVKSFINSYSLCKQLYVYLLQGVCEFQIGKSTLIHAAGWGCKWV